MNHRYILAPYNGHKSRQACPNCKKSKSFTHYIDIETNEIISDLVGRCNREINCGYHYTPKQYFADHSIPLTQNFKGKQYNTANKLNEIHRPASVVDLAVLKSTLNNYEHNALVLYLRALFGLNITTGLIKDYCIGTSFHWPGSTVFWQIDIDGKVKAGKIMLYNQTTGRRIKEPYNHITWVHKSLKLTDFNMKQCFFGEHLLQKHQEKPVAIVESEKTALIASVYLPQFIWLACGSLSNLTEKRCCVLKNRNVTLYPDLNGYEKWHAKLLLLGLQNCKISNLLESRATIEEKKQGLDLADFLLRFPVAEFVSSINIQFSDIEFMPVEIHTGIEFGKLIIVWVVTSSGRSYDVLFKASGEPLHTSEMKKEVRLLSNFFEKIFSPAMFLGLQCWVCETKK